MLDIGAFDQVYSFDPSYTYDNEKKHSIQQRRKEYKHLFFDRLIKVLHVKASADHKPLYPPQSNSALRQLHAAIISAPAPQHHKHALLYYLLSDVGATGGSTTGAAQAGSPASAFADAVRLPAKYRTVTEGLWQLDQGDLAGAVDSLSQPALLPTFAAEVLETLLRAQQWPLALAYWRAVDPAIPADNPALRGLLFDLVLRSGVRHALAYLRAQPLQERRHLFDRLLAFGLEHARGDQLADLPLSREEEGWFEEFLLRGKGRKLPRATDTVFIRLVALGRVKEALEVKKEHKLVGMRKGSLGWDELAEGLRKAVEGNSPLKE